MLENTLSKVILDRGKGVYTAVDRYEFLNGRCQKRYLESRADDESQIEPMSFLVFSVLIYEGESVVWI